MLSDGLAADAVDHFELHELVRQEMQSPLLPAVRRRTAGDLDQTRFTLAVELWLPWGALLRIQRFVDTLERTTLAYAFYRADTHIQVLRDMLVLQALVRFE